MTPHEAGKGDRYRPVDQKKWYENYQRIFGDGKLVHARRRAVSSGIDPCQVCDQITCITACQEKLQYREKHHD